MLKTDLKSAGVNIIKKVLVSFLVLYSFNCKFLLANTNEGLILKTIDLGTHKLSSYYYDRNTDYFLVFEAGLGNDASVWKNSKLVKELMRTYSVLMYDRAGYGSSSADTSARNIDNMSNDLSGVIDSITGNKKLVLIGHSLGCLIIRDYAIKHPDRVKSIVFIDPSHEDYNLHTKEIVDGIYNSFKAFYGEKFGGTLEAKELDNDFKYIETRPKISDKPLLVFTSMKTDKDHDEKDRKKWFDAHKKYGEGITDFKHIATSNSGHYIFVEEPELVLNEMSSFLK
ncbi:MAG: alpha/beta fold hydrolase [Bacteroidetes bacterium]|nr:alpha/beta fold hydrolase [Bacteroidota bacterium]